MASLAGPGGGDLSSDSPGRGPGTSYLPARVARRWSRPTRRGPILAPVRGGPLAKTLRVWTTDPER